ncbi:MAG: EamA family transporter [Steroidobacteraceae bacterium]|nr:EamA family transporter [Steroidobacteraceae bacterium]
MPDGGRRLKVALALATVYLVWGSSYLATKVMVAEEPPLTAAAYRFLLAAVILGSVALWRGERPPRVRREWRTAALTGLFTVVASNGTNVLAMQHVPSNVAAMLNATPALWIAWLGTMGRRAVPLSGMARAGLLVGLLGVALILWPKGGLLPPDFRWQFVILLGCLGWSLGTMVYRNDEPTTPTTMFTAMQMLCGGLGLLALAAVSGAPLTLTLEPRGLAAFLWLTLASSCLAYTAYAYLVHNTSPAVVGTYGYVNPAIAALIGWLVLGEVLSLTQVLGMMVIFVAVALVTGYLGRWQGGRLT